MKLDRSFKRVLITGVSGSGGSYLAERILHKYPDCSLFGISRTRTLNQLTNLDKIKQAITVFSCDLRDPQNINRVLIECKPNIIFNIASQANVLDSYQNVYSNSLNNVELIVNLLEGIRNSSPQSILVHCSTSEVYGKVNSDEVPISENQEFRPSSPYSVSKIFQDLMCDVYSKSFSLKIIKTRMFSYVNPRRSDLFASSFAKQIVEIERGVRKVLKHGNLDSVRTILDVRDAMDAYIAAAEMCTFGDTYNIGGDYTVSVGDVLQKLISLTDCEILTELDPKLLRPVDVTLQIPDDKKFRLQTKWQPQFSLDETLAMLMDYWRK